MTSVRPQAAPPPPPRPREDHGFFGPGSATWKVWTAPTAVIGFQRSIVVETFDPFLAAAVHQQNGVRYDPRGRMDRTFAYFLTVAVGDGRAAIEASEALMRVHARVRGTEPVSGLPYSANSPETQLWIHVTGWHSNLYCYERYGPGPLSAADERRYWAECRVAAELQTCDPARVPASRSEVRDYYQWVRPRLMVSEHARALFDHFLYTPLNPKTAPLWLGSRAMTAATIATIPRWMRRLGGFDQPLATDVAIRPIAQAAVRAGASPRAQLATLAVLAPSARPILRSILAGERPLRSEVVTPAQARARHGRSGGDGPTSHREPPRHPQA